MIERADQGLYVAKKTGRNRTFLMPASEDRDARAAWTSSSPCAITLRMTLGNASSASVAIGTQRMPSARACRAATRAV